MKKGIKKVLTVLAVSAVSAFTLMVAGCNGSAGDWVQEKINQLKCEHATTRLIQQVEPTCTEKGATSGVECVDCGKVITKPDTIDAKGHNLIHYDEVKATCLLSGLSAGDYCADCDTWVKERKEIKATGHKVVELKGVAPTCTETGLSVGQGCEYCGEVYVAQEVLPIVEHKLNILGDCVVCGYTAPASGDSLKVGTDVTGYKLRLKEDGAKYVEAMTANGNKTFCVVFTYTSATGESFDYELAGMASYGMVSIGLCYGSDGPLVNETLITADGVVKEDFVFDYDGTWVVKSIDRDSEWLLSLIEFYT